MTEGAGPGLIRVAYFERTSALMTVASVVLSEGLLLVLVGTTHRLEALLVGVVTVALVSLALLPFGLRLPARRRRKYEQAVRIGVVEEPRADQDAARRLSLRRTAGFVGAVACWMTIIGLTFHDLMPPILLVVVAVTQWARARATARWERENGAALWQDVPGVLGVRNPVFRLSAAGEM
ncbi:hypothetical protein ACWEO4_17545 [Streptomyces sp. NPDC004393]|uniref:hypothetical protein n=1 Tax=Streptomyces sp. NPDC004533 TaxID=3154278 RepID=UPI0033AE83B0